MFWHVSVCLSTPRGLHQPGPGGGGTPARSSWGGVPLPGPAGGFPLLEVPLPGGTPPSVPTIGPGWGVPQWEYPTLGTPIRPGHWVPQWGYPTSGTPVRPGSGLPQPGRSDLTGGTTPWVLPPSDLAGGTPTRGTPPQVPHQSGLTGGLSPAGGIPPWVPPGQTWLGGTPMGGYPTVGNTWYAAVSMPPAFTQEDLFGIFFYVRYCCLIVFHGSIMSR